MAQLTQMAPGGAGNSTSSAPAASTEKTATSGTTKSSNGTAASTGATAKSDSKKESAKTSQGNSSSGAVQLQDLQKILSGMQQAGPASG